MIDLRLLRENPDLVRDGFARLGATVDLPAVMALDEEVRRLKNDTQGVAAEQNKLSKEIGRAANPEARAGLLAQGAALKQRLEALTTDLVVAESRLDEKALDLPNLPTAHWIRGHVEATRSAYRRAVDD